MVNTSTMGGLWLLALNLFAVAAEADCPAFANIVYSWGGNSSGQLGDGTTVDRQIPTPVIGLSSDAPILASAGTSHTLAVRNGAAYAWGFNGAGQLGDGRTSAMRNSPSMVVGLSSGVTAIAAAGAHSLAVKDGSVYAWGWNDLGQLGIGSTNGRDVPTAVGGLTGGVTAVAGSLTYSLAIRNGGLYAWGENVCGQLGDGTTSNHSTPVAVLGMGSNVSALAAGTYHGLAVKDGSAYAWGWNGRGQLGAVVPPISPIPTAIPGLGDGVTAVAAGFGHSLAVKDGRVYAWGGNEHGQLGNGTKTGWLRPAQVEPSILSNIVTVAAGLYSSYALAADGNLFAWGDNSHSELTTGNAADYLVPTRVQPPDGYIFTSITAGDYHAVATLAIIPEPVPLLLVCLPVFHSVRSRGRSRRSATVSNPLIGSSK